LHSSSVVDATHRRAGRLRKRGLVYTTDATPGFSRYRRGSGFAYRQANGKALRQATHLARIRSLAIPPAWKDVWISPRPDGHLQATGRDARGRKQYRYHPEWTALTHETKYSRLVDFATALPALRRRVAADLSSRGMPRSKVLALIAHLLERTMIRVGNREYRRANGSFGLTTLLDRHVQIEGCSIRFRFRGKGGKVHDVAIADPRVARLVRNCQELPGSQLFQYVDADGQQQDVGSADVNEYLRSVMGEAFTAKDFRTWAGTVLAAEALYDVAPGLSRTAAEREVVTAIEAVSGVLGNTRAVCRRCYVHPTIIEAFLDGGLGRAIRPSLRRRRVEGLRPMEVAVLAFLQRRLSTGTAKAA